MIMIMMVLKDVKSRFLNSLPAAASAVSHVTLGNGAVSESRATRPCGLVLRRGNSVINSDRDEIVLRFSSFVD